MMRKMRNVSLRSNKIEKVFESIKTTSFVVPYLVVGAIGSLSLFSHELSQYPFTMVFDVKLSQIVY